MVEQIKCYCGHTTYCDCIPLEELKQERMFSEEDMLDFAKFCLLCKDEELPYIFPKDWLKHIKKK